MLRKIRLPLLTVTVACFVGQASAAVPHGALGLSAHSGAAKKENAPKIAYHDMRHSRSVEQTAGVGAFKRGELRIDRGLNCFLAGSGDLICFSAGLDKKTQPAQDVTQDEKAPATSSE
ncbi:hypothetical protein [Pelagibius sp. Alg239-R121]|uniref:hypothetical protein n=1 Tax=Pelagibius sp. Alg239-R121 TaxID=2993448 RepID=UPI0024A67D33|nr:hypothetical protein [Pelagibius sp. Alg239-R121]